jgi:hypothetical protein
MLILTRRVGETVMIGDWIAVTVLDVKGNQVRLGAEKKSTPVSSFQFPAFSGPAGRRNRGAPA